MNEIKQLLMNGLFKKILLCVFILISSFCLVFLNHDKWVEHKSLVQLFVWAVILQASLFGLIKLLSWCPWKRIYSYIKNKWFNKKIDCDVAENLLLIRDNFKQVSYYLNGLSEYSWVSKFYRKKIKLPIYFCFESTDGMVETEIKKGFHEQVPTGHFSHTIKIILSEKAVFCVLSSDLFEQKNDLWKGFLKIVKKYANDFSSISALIMVGAQESVLSDSSKLLSIYRYKIEELSQCLNQKVPIHGVSYQVMAFPGFESFRKGNQDIDNRVLNINLSGFSSDEKKEQLINFFGSIIKRWTLDRFFSIEKNKEILDKWEKFVFSDSNMNLIEQLSIEWGTFVQDTPFIKSTSLSSLYIIESTNAQKMIWPALVRQTINLEKTNVNGNYIYNDMIKNMKMAGLILIFLIFTTFNILHVFKINKLTNFFQRNIFDLNFGLVSKIYTDHRDLDLKYGGIFSVYKHGGWKKSKRELVSILGDKLNRMASMLEDKLVDKNNQYSKIEDILIINKNLKVLLTLVNQSPETLERQVLCLISWMQDERIISKKEIPVTQIMMEDYFKQNDCKWVSQESTYIDVAKKVKHNLNNVSPLKTFSAKLSMVEKELKLGFIDKVDLFQKGSMDLIQFRYELPKLYTSKGWKTIVEPLIETLIHHHAKSEDWIRNFDKQNNLGDYKSKTSAELKEYLHEAYFKDYERHWEKFLQGIALKPFLNTNDAAVKLGFLLDSEGAWENLFMFLKKNMEPLWRQQSKKLKKLGVFLSLNPLEEKNSSKDTYDRYFEELKSIQAELDGLLLHSDQGRAIERYLDGLFIQSSNEKNSLFIMGNNLFKMEKCERIKLFKSFYKVLFEPVKKVFSAISKDGVLNIEKDWRSEVAEPFNNNLSKKFPFKNVDQEVVLADFSYFFNPLKGKVSQFIESRISCFIQRDKDKITPKKWAGEAVPISAQFLKGIDQIRIFSQGLFDQKSGEVMMRLQLLPEPSPYFSEFSIDLNGSYHNYRNDPEEWKLLEWPGKSDYPKSAFSATTIDPPCKLFESLSGEWSFFRLLKQYASWSKISPGNYRVFFKFRTDKKEDINTDVIFNLKTDTKLDFFKMIEIDQFEMVDKVYGKL